MKIIAIIPARYQSSRFPGKPLTIIAGKPMIQWVYERTKKVDELDEIYVATDDNRIQDCVLSFGGKCLMTASTHQSGSDRLAECIDILNLDDEDVVLNIQGDEPLIQKQMIYDLMDTMNDGSVMGTLKERIRDTTDIENTNIVKVVTDRNFNALYFSRLPIPYNREHVKDVTYYRHVGVYAYRVGFLREYASWENSKYETIEGLEQLRVLEHGYKIKVKETSCSSIGIDTPEQVVDVEKVLMEEGRG